MASNADTWSATAKAYAKQIADATGKAGDGLLDLTETVLPLTKNAVVLETGAGTGGLTSRLLTRCTDVSVVATDIAVLEAKGLSAKTQVLDATADYVTQGLLEESQTHVLSTFMHQFIPPVQNANEAVDPWNIACKNLDPSFQPFEPAPGLFEWRTTEDVEAAFTATGFVECRSAKAESYLAFDDAEQYADAFLTANNPVWLMAQKAWKGDMQDVKEELTKVIREQFRDGKIVLEAGFIVARKPMQG